MEIVADGVDAVPAGPGNAPACAAVLGDVVASRRAADRAGLQQRLRAALGRTNDKVPALQPLQPTIGDEFQGIYTGLGVALNATLFVRLLLHGVTDVRFGVGWGALAAWDAERVPFEQDGPAWWAARDALETVAGQARRTGSPAGLRTGVALAEPAEPAAGRQGPPAAPGLDPAVLLESAVLFRDHVVHALDERDVGLVVALLDGATVTAAATRVGISQQAASGRLQRNGGYSLVRGWQLLERRG